MKTIKLYGVLIVLASLFFLVLSLIKNEQLTRSNADIQSIYEKYTQGYQYSTQETYRNLKQTVNVKSHFIPMREWATDMLEKVGIIQESLLEAKTKEEYEFINKEILKLKQSYFDRMEEVSLMELPGTKFTETSKKKLWDDIVYNDSTLQELSIQNTDYLKVAMLNRVEMMKAQLLNFIASNLGNKMLCDDFLRFVPINTNPSIIGQKDTIQLSISTESQCFSYYDYDLYYVNGESCPVANREYRGGIGAYYFLPEEPGWDSLHLRVDRIDYDGTVKHSEEQWVKFWVDP